MRLTYVTITAFLVLLTSGAHAEEAEPPLHASGFIESGYAVATRHADGVIAGNLYEPRNEEFMFHAAELKLERSAPANRRGTGFVVEAMAGGHATAVRAAGFDLGPHADVTQAYGILSLPAARLQLSVGKMSTLLGNEVIQSVGNSNLSVGSQYVFVENFTDTGVDAAWTGGGGWSARARAVNGWDVVSDNNHGKTVFGKIGWNDPRRSIALIGYTGVELPDSIGGQRTGVELLANAPLGSVTATLQLDAGSEQGLDAGWQAAGIWLRAPIGSEVDLALRGDVLDDANGARTSGALGFPAIDRQTLVGVTGTLIVRSVPGALIRPEVRYDRSDREVFDGRKEQWTFALGAALLF
jgi:hypothetical protein